MPAGAARVPRRFASGFAFLVGIALSGALPACVGTTGGDIVDFRAAASGNGKVDFVTDRGWHVVLSKATLHVGAVYLDGTLPVSGAQNTACILPGTYVAEVTAGRDVDLLSSEPQFFPVLGHGTTLPARAGQLWLTGGDVNDPSDDTEVLGLEGVADRDGDNRPFAASVTIAENRADSTSEIAGSNPICKERIVSPIPLAVSVETAGGLRLVVDPTFFFVNVEFGDLSKTDGTYRFVDATDGADQPSVNLFDNLRAARAPTRYGSLYSISWDEGL